MTKEKGGLLSLVAMASAKGIKWRHNSILLNTKFWVPGNGLMGPATSGIWNQIHMKKIDLETTE